jgi:AraC-like DNA-binding protein
VVVQAKAADEALLARLKPGLDWFLGFMEGPAAGPGRPLLKRAGDYADAHLGEKLSVSRAAEALGMSPSAFARDFRKASGSGFRHFVAKRRVEEACKWLAQSDLAIPEIASKCGFRDLHYFSLVFKKLKGIPPARYRRRERAGQGAGFPSP